MHLSWQFFDKVAQEVVLQLAQELSVPPIIARVMLNRGIDSHAAALAFFRTNLEHMHDPFLMADMTTAVERLAQALAQREKILIYGDYDVDGTTATALIRLVMRELGFDVPFYIPDRLKEGYGISRAGLDWAREQGVKLIVAVDCGVTAHKEIAYARDHGIDVIVCDHHQPAHDLPPATALLDPKRSDCPYPFKELAGVGVTFKLLQGLFQHLQRDPQGLFRYLDLVAIGSAADIVPLVDENRVLVKAGLERLNHTENVGMQALIQVCGLQQCPITTSNIVFILGPRINAVGRMGDAGRAVKLLTAQEMAQAMDIARVLEVENRERRSVDEETYREAVAMIEEQGDHETRHAFVLHKEDWHTGVIGIVASRIVEKYYRPTVLISVQKGMGKGSARSINGFDLYQALQECESSLAGYGGHKYAAGLSIPMENIDAFRARFEQVAKGRLTPEMLTPRLMIDGEIRLPEIDSRFMRFLDALAPYGPQNMRPVFVARELRVVGTPQIVGNNHLRFYVTQNDKKLDCIGFNLGDLLPRLRQGRADVEMAFLVEENTWQGRTTIQLRVKDIR
jgi:single-stranded-DNA-specific exonuclease